MRHGVKWGLNSHLKITIYEADVLLSLNQVYEFNSRLYRMQASKL